jgi:very-short-patch-repair endonuclease
MAELDRRIAEVARAQRALVTLDDIRAAGGGPAQVHHRIKQQTLERVAPRVYAVRASPSTHDARLLAAVLSVKGAVALSHLAAARRYGMPGYRDASAELTVNRGTRIHRPGVRIHESTDLDRCQIIDLDGVPTTYPSRTLLDLARFVGPQRLARNVEWARRSGLTDWPVLIRTLAAHARRGRPGIQKLRAVLDANAGRIEVTDSDLELLVLSLLREHGLPEPVLHHEVWDGDRFVAELDLAYPERRIGIECDGDIHLRADVRERDLPRQNDLVLLGWTILRFSPNRYWTRRNSIVAEVRAALRAP